MNVKRKLSKSRKERNMKYVVVGPWCWGMGGSLKQAIKNAQENYPARGPMPYNAWVASDDVEVNEFGHVSARELKRVREARVEGGQLVVREGAAMKGN